MYSPAVSGVASPAARDRRVVESAQRFNWRLGLALMATVGFWSEVALVVVKLAR